MNRFVPVSIVLVACATLTSAAQAGQANTLCPPVSSSTALATKAPAPDGANQSLAELVFGPAMRGVVYFDSGCTVYDTCANGSQISCSGTIQCSTATTFCSDQGSTCPGQSSNVPAVQCDNVIRQSCTCPAVCFGCDTACTRNADCASACTCGGGRCSSGHCSCRY